MGGDWALGVLELVLAHWCEGLGPRPSSGQGQVKTAQGGLKAAGLLVTGVLCLHLEVA